MKPKRKRTAEQLQRMSEGRKRAWAAAGPEGKQLQAERVRKWWASLSPERQQEIVDKRNEAIRNHRANWDPEEKRAMGMKVSKSRKEYFDTQGVTRNETYGFDFTKELKCRVRERDGYLCVCCGVESMSHDVHHIDYCKKNGEIDNLIALCKSCHTKTNRNRKYWKQFFGVIVGTRKAMRNPLPALTVA